MSTIKVTYWPWAHGRAMALNAMCEYQEVEYEFVPHNPQNQEKAITANNFAVPAVLLDDGEWYSQLMVAMTALGYKLNLNVKGENEIRAQNTLTNIYDIACEANSKRSQIKTVDEATAFLESRVSPWCEVIENNYKWADKNGEGPYWEGENVSYVEFMLLQFVEQMYFMFGKDRVMKVFESKMPVAFNAYNTLREAPKINEFLATKPIFPEYMNNNASLLSA